MVLASPATMRGTVFARILHQGRGDAERYRCQHLAEQLDLLGLSTSVEEFVRGEPCPVGACALLVLHRVPLDGFLRREIARARRAGAVILADTDDLVFEPRAALEFSRSIGDSFVRRTMFVEDVRCFCATVLASDGALVSTRFLADRIEALGRPAWIHRNAFSAEMARSAERALAVRREGGPVVIGYASGTPTHARDFALVAPVLSEILDCHPEVEVRVVGHLDVDELRAGCVGRVRSLPFVPWRELPATLAAFDVNLAPLEVGRPFCEAKSEIKYIEAALVGVPTVASPTAAFAKAIRLGENGLLAANAEEWRARLTELIGSAELRRKVGAAARVEVLAHHSPQARATELEAALDSVFRRVRGCSLRSSPASDLAVSGEPDSSFAPGTTHEASVARRSHLRQALYSLRYDSPRSFAVRMLVFAALRLRRSAGATDGTHGAST